MRLTGQSIVAVAAAAVCSALLVLGTTTAVAAPTADDHGYLDSTARCRAPDSAVAFGSTDTSRVAICKTPAGQYEYRGVRVRDGAKLVVPAVRSDDGRFVADSDGVTYTVTATSLAIRSGDQVIREEPMVDFHEPQASKPSSAPTATAKPPAPSTPTPTTPLPPPLRAEVGGGGH